ncbi:MAG: LTA synthase family protein [Candidatus Paceibacterota bacterium]|nr:LTA synthase family protein [Candidatus Paceibacterota bacterium]
MKQILSRNSFIFLPLSLAVLFVAQNQIFNVLVGLHNNPFLSQFMFATFALGVILYAPSVLFPRWWRYGYLCIISIAVAALFISQYLYFSFFGGFMQASALKYAGQVGDQAGTIYTLIDPSMMIFLLQFLVIFAAVYLEKRGLVTETLHNKKEKTLFAVGIVLIGLLGYGTVIFGSGEGWKKLSHFPQTIREMHSFVFSPNYEVQRTGIFNYFAGDVIGLIFRSTKLTADDIALVTEWKDANPGPKTERYFGAASGKNLIIVQFESLETEVLFEEINGEEITPNLNKLAKEGLYFDNYYTQVGPGNTADAEFVTLNSLYSLPNTVAFIDFAHNKYQALPSLLKQNGYHTYALHADVPTFWNRSNIYPGLGYDRSYSKTDFVIPKNLAFDSLDDENFFMQGLQKMEEFESPFMATYITLTSHTPFTIPKKFQALDFPQDSPYNELQKNYMQSVHYSDQALGKFIDGLKSAGKYDNSLIAVYGDHGTQTMLGDIMGTSTSKILPELRSSIGGAVPFIILGSELPAKTYHVPGSHLDFYPTIANLMGISPTSRLFGRDLLGTNHRVTLRNAYSRAITAILTETIAYKNFTEGGAFENGQCLKMPEQTAIPLSDCKAMYDEEVKATNASDLVIKGNLISKLMIQK